MSKIQDAIKRIQGEEPDGQKTVRLSGSAARESRNGRKVYRGEVGLAAADRIIDIDMEALRLLGMVAAEDDQPLIAAQFGEIKRPLIAHAFGRRATKVSDGHLIMISSAIAGEGKTFTALNLAFSMAQEKDLSVVLVDADVLKPHISEILDVADAPGLLDALEDKSIDPESLIIPTNIGGLSVLPTGKRRLNSTELLASARMDEVVSGLQRQGVLRIVLFDSAPLLVTTESKIIASIAGQVVLVVKAESTEQGAVNSAIELLDEDKAVSLILNQARAIRNRQVYGYTESMSSYSGQEESD